MQKNVDNNNNMYKDRYFTFLRKLLELIIIIIITFNL